MLRTPTALVLAVSLIACTGAPVSPTPAPTADDPADDVSADAGAVPMAPAEPGLVSEAAFKAAHALKEGDAAQLRGQMVELPGGSSAYLSVPEGAEGPLPAVVVIHEWWGLNDHIKQWSDRLADDGYAALAVDLYGGRVATSPDEAMGLMKQVDEEAAVGIVREAHRYLVAADGVKARKVGSIGWCFGGGWSLRLAQAEPDLDAAVIYYGRLTADEAALRSVNAPILGHFAANDQGIPVASVQAFHDTLKTLEKPVTVHMYDADHAFANPSGKHYDAADAEVAWGKTRDFLAHHLK